MKKAMEARCTHCGARTLTPADRVRIIEPGLEHDATGGVMPLIGGECDDCGVVSFAFFAFSFIELPGTLVESDRCKR